MIPNTDRDRRLRRSEMPHVAMGLQLRFVAERLGLEAIVLADDLGTPLAFAGDPGLSGILAQASMWVGAEGPGLDWYAAAWLEEVDPSITSDDIVSVVIPRRGSAGHWRVTAIGRDPETPAGVVHAVTGIRRIASGPRRDAR